MPVQFDPEIPWLPLLIGGGALVALGVRLAWLGNRDLPRRRRLALAVLRGLALLGIVALFSNPGRWETETDPSPPGWGLLLDRSASMAVPDGAEGKTRWETGADFAERLLSGSSHPESVRSHLYDAALGPLWSPGNRDTSNLATEGSRLDLAARSLLETATAEASRWTGLVIVGDGRQTVADPDLAALITQARSFDIPVHTVPIGGEVTRRDLSVRASRRQLVSLPGQEIQVPLRIANSGLSPTTVTVRIEKANGEALDDVPPRKLQVDTGADISIDFPLPAGTPSGDYFVILDPTLGDEIPANDSDRFHLRLLDKRSRIFLAEGAPYWDTKFLTQLLRGQELIEVDAVYRIRPDRYYRIGTGETPALEETSRAFPETDAEMANYDLVVLGKGAEAFLTPERVDRLSRFVRDRGGSLLFSRGKPYAGNYEGLASLEPGNWGEETGSDYRLMPTVDGAESGLFGERLPGPEHALWHRLDPLEDVRTLAELKPFTRILAVGERVEGGSRVPLLVVRRHGRGVVAAVNGDGLWRWGFHPRLPDTAPRPGGGAPEDWHREFWMQTIQWTATWSEFLPGEDYSIQVTPSTLAPGDSGRVRIGFRGDLDSAREMSAPVIEITGPTSSQVQAAPAGSAEDGIPRWGAIVSSEIPGAYTLTLVIDGERGPSVPLTVPPPVGENDDRSADRALMEELSRETGGSVWELDQVDSLLATLEPDLPPVATREAVWSPLWNRPWILLLIALLLGTEWAARRRFGLP